MKVMKKLILAIIFFLFCVGIALISFIVGNKIASKKANIIIDTSKLTGLSFANRDQGSFCANSVCSVIGIRGVINRYDPNKKLLTLRYGEKWTEVSLTNSTRIDASGGISFFEEQERVGDVIIIIIEKENPSEAKEIYFDKTGATPIIN